MEFKPHIVFPPGEIIRDELAERGWTQSQLAEILGRPLQVVNGIVNGKREITPETALQIAAAFGTSAEMWVRMDAEYRLFRAQSTFRNGQSIATRVRKAG